MTMQKKAVGLLNIPIAGAVHALQNAVIKHWAMKSPWMHRYLASHLLDAGRSNPYISARSLGQQAVGGLLSSVLPEVGGAAKSLRTLGTELRTAKGSDLGPRDYRHIGSLLQGKVSGRTMQIILSNPKLKAVLEGYLPASIESIEKVMPTVTDTRAVNDMLQKYRRGQAGGLLGSFASGIGKQVRNMPYERPWNAIDPGLHKAVGAVPHALGTAGTWMAGDPITASANLFKNYAMSSSLPGAARTNQALSTWAFQDWPFMGAVKAYGRKPVDPAWQRLKDYVVNPVAGQLHTTAQNFGRNLATASDKWKATAKQHSGDIQNYAAKNFERLRPTIEPMIEDARQGLRDVFPEQPRRD